MERVIFVEILDRRGQVRERHRVERLPFRIGRAYHNDLILDDPYVSPVHAQIEGSDPGPLTLRDLGSENGIEGVVGRLQDDRVALEIPCELRLGRTRLRLRDMRHAVEATAVDPTTSALGWLIRQPLAGLLVLMAVVATTLSEELAKTQGVLDWGGVAESFLTSALITALWVGLWSLITLVLTHQTRFLGHWIVAGSYALFQAGMRWAGTWIRFFVASIVPVQFFELAVHLAVATLLFFAHISLTGALRTPRRLLLAGVLSLTFVSLSQIDTVFRRPDWIQVLPYWSRLQPVDPKWLATEEVGEFFDGAAGIRDAVDALARRRAEAQSRKDSS